MADGKFRFKHNQPQGFSSCPDIGDGKRAEYINGSITDVAPGAIVSIELIPELSRFILPFDITVACFKSNNGSVATPLERLPTLLEEVLINGYCPVRGGILLGIHRSDTDENGEKTEDPDPADEDDKLFIFRNLHPIQVSWPTIGNLPYEAARLQFKNICDCHVNIYAKIGGHARHTDNPYGIPCP